MGGPMNDLIERIEVGEKSNELDVLIEVALFKPDEDSASCRANSAGTKVIYTDHHGREWTHWAPEHTSSPTITLAALKARAYLKETNNAD